MGHVTRVFAIRKQKEAPSNNLSPPKKKTNKQPLLLTRIRPGRDVNDSFVFYESEEDKALTKTMKKTKKKEKKKKNDVRQ